jgi:hypothetical protein
MLGLVEVELTSKASSWKGCRVAYTAALRPSTAAEEEVIPAFIIAVDSTPPRRAERLRAAIFDAGDSPRRRPDHRPERLSGACGARPTWSMRDVME